MDKERRKSRLLPSIQSEFIRQFVAGVPARTAAELTGVDRNTAILFFHKLRERMLTSSVRLKREQPKHLTEGYCRKMFSGPKLRKS
jgi:transposase-like protein